MSQVATRRKIELTDERVEVRAAFEERGSILAGSKRGECLGFEIKLMIAAEAAADELAELAKLSRRMCFTEAALTTPAPLEVQIEINGEVLPDETDNS